MAYSLRNWFANLFHQILAAIGDPEELEDWDTSDAD
jgi:hypothetical protein